MKKYIVLYGMLFAAVSYGNAFGVTTTPVESGCCMGSVCGGYIGDGSCKSCTSDLQCRGLTPTTCPDECPNSTWTVIWPDSGGVLKSAPQYETRCVSGVCQYQCAAGSYGNPTSSTSGCSRCPGIDTPTSQYGISNYYGESPAGSKNITDCYAPSDTSYTDSTGKYEFTSDCYYTE